MRVQRRLDRFLTRYADQQSTLYQSLQMPEAVVPVVTVGNDYADTERASFRASTVQAAVAGQAAFLIVAPVTADILIEAAHGGSPGGATGFDAQLLPVQFALGTPPTAPGGLWEQSGQGPMCAFVAQGTAIGVVPQVYQVSGNASREVFLPRSGVIVERGFAFAMKGANVGQAMQFAIYWRNVGGVG